MGDKVEYEYYGKKTTGWLMVIYPPKLLNQKWHKCFGKLTFRWGIKETRVSHLNLIDEKQIIRKISSDFIGYKKVYRSVSDLKLLEEAKKSCNQKT